MYVPSVDDGLAVKAGCGFGWQIYGKGNLGNPIKINRGVQKINNKNSLYNCWLGLKRIRDEDLRQKYKKYCKNIFYKSNDTIILTAIGELESAINRLFDVEVKTYAEHPGGSYIFVGT